MEELLGVQVPDDTRGCLQDIHWSLQKLWKGIFEICYIHHLYTAIPERIFILHGLVMFDDRQRSL